MAAYGKVNKCGKKKYAFFDAIMFKIVRESVVA